MSDHPLVIVGGGAAGLMAAIAAGEAGAGDGVLLLERSRDGGRKILISGGGRCNVLPSELDPRRYVTASSPNVMRRLLRSWPLAEQRRWFEETLGIPLRLEPETGKLFPVSNRARDVRDALVDRARALGAELRFESSLERLEPLEPAAGRRHGWRLGLADGTHLRARAVVLATGGLSVPATGSDGTGLRLLELLGHRVNPLYPALAPLTADPPVHAELAGVSLEVTLHGRHDGERREERGGFLFTHRGYSGPAVMNLSHLVALARASGHAPGEGAELEVRWTHESREVWDARLRALESGPVGSELRRCLPQRLADRLMAEAGVDPQTPASRLTREGRAALARALGAWTLPWAGDEGYRKAEVTGGGVDLAEVDPRTLESRRRAGLFLCGELLDAFGPIGGYNFAWAWATGRMAGRAAAAAGARADLRE